MLLGSLTDFASGFVQHWGYLAVFLVAGLESLCIPFLPGETALLTAAVLAGTTHQLAIAGVIAAGALGPIVGGSLGFGIGWWGGYRLVVRYGDRVRLGQPQVKIARYLFRRHGGKVVFLGRFVLVLRSFAGLLAGASRMPPPAFLGYNAAGSLVWAVAYGLAAYAASSAFQALSGWLAIGFGIVAVVIVVLAVVAIRRQERRLEAVAEREFPGPLEGYPGGAPL
ncbi:MAG TPA: DedA family protein [Candidatus Binatia bacterium]|nr:DedA family protein [Candidatus Binatia bacterium]